MCGHDFLLAKARDINANAEASAKEAERAAEDAKKTKNERELESLLDAIPKSPQSLLSTALFEPGDSYQDEDGIGCSSANVSAAEPGGSRIIVENESIHTHPPGEIVPSDGDGRNILSDHEKGESMRTR